MRHNQNKKVHLK